MTEPHQATYVRLPTVLHRQIKDRAAAEDRTMAQTIRLALRFYLKNTTPLLGTDTGANRETQ